MDKTLAGRGALIIGIVCAAAWTAGPRLRQWASSGASRSDAVDVLVAGRYVPALTPIKDSMVRAQEMPKSLVPPGAFHQVSELQNDNGQFIFMSAVAIPEGQPLSQNLLVDAQQGQTLAALVRPGKVAVSFAVDKAHGVGGWVKPGDTVALLASTAEPHGVRAGRQRTQLLLPAIPVLAVDTERLGEKPERPEGAVGDPPASMEAPPGDTRILTVLVSPSAATAIIEAREQGELSVVLRAIGDDLPWPGN